MAKSSKRRPNPAPAHPAATGSANIAPAATGAIKKRPTSPPTPARQPGFTLIHFDARAKWYLGIVVGLFVLFTLTKIHTISTPIWDLALPDGTNSPQRGLLAGTPREIRVDEWGVSLPWEMSNISRGFPLENETIGGKQVGLLLMPTYHLYSFFRPANWGFLLLDAERGLAWKGNIDYLLLLTGAFLLLMLLTRNNFGLSVFGSLWLLMSSGIQNWNGGISVVFGFYCYLFVVGVYLLFSEQRSWRWVAWSVLFGWLLFTEVFLIYPPYQVPLGYTFLILFAGYVYTNRHQAGLRYQFPQKLALVLAGVASFGLLFYSIYADLKPTFDAVSQTVYPGKRSETGGTGFKANWFSEYYSWLVNPGSFPKSWDNICELAHFVTFVPVVIPAIIVCFYRNRKIDWMLAGLSGFVVVMLLWMTFHWPTWLAEGTLMSMSPTRRMQIPLGVSSVLLTVLYLNYLKTNTLTINKLVQTGLIGSVGLFMVYTAYVNLNDSEGFFKPYQLIIPVIVLTVLNALLLPTIRWPYRQLVFTVGLLLFLLPNMGFNPLSRGLSPITDHALYKAVKAIQATDPDARWVAYDNRRVSELITATGVNIISGVKYIPPMNIYSVLDPDKKLDSLYNRYAHTIYKLNIDQKDGIIMQNLYDDELIVAMDPCSPRLHKLNVRYVVFDGEQTPLATRCMTLVQQVGTIKIYRVDKQVKLAGQ